MCGIFSLIRFGGNLDNSVVGCLEKLINRGPDKTNYITWQTATNGVFMGFTRLAIMDTSDKGLQPFGDSSFGYVICNGEIYNYKQLAKKYNIDMETDCDCEILLPLIKKIGFDKMIETELDAEFATVYFDSTKNIIRAARDRFGVRPLYYGYNNTTRTICIGSELKALHPVCDAVHQLAPNMTISIYLDKYSDQITNISTLIKFRPYYSYDLLKNPKYLTNSDDIQDQIRRVFTQAVSKRLYADRPIGFLLSGGLDSSLVVAIATKILGRENIVCFSVGMDNSPDVIAAKKVTNYLGIKNHHIIPFNVKIGTDNLVDVVRTIETYDITTIRASTPQYLMAKYISKHTDIKVILSGEGSDEIHGSYKYMRFAPNKDSFHDETILLLSELCYFDNARTDRTMAGCGLEVRVPFLDMEYVELVARISPELLMYRHDNIEKKIVRDSFKGYLPDEILYRPKEAFSDAVSTTDTNWYKSVATMADQLITDEELVTNPYQINRPQTKEALYYRRIFDSIYPGRDSIIPHYWLPRFPLNNIITDPSATILPDN